MPIKPLNADDIFISYTRRDASTYANGLADALEKRNLHCYLDALGTEPGADLPESLKRRIRNSQMFVLICTRRSGQRETIRKEIEEFLKTGRKQNIVPVDINGSFYKARWLKLVEGVNPATETNLLALKDGNPTLQVVERIDKQFIFRRADERRQLVERRAKFVLAGLLFFIIVAIGVAGYQSWRAIAETRKAEQATLDARQSLAQAQLAKDAAKAAQDEADRAKGEAETARADATEQKRLADEAARDAEAKTKLADAAAQRARQAEARATTEQARAERERTIAEARALANRSQTSLRQHPLDVPRSTAHAVNSMKKVEAIKVHAVEADTALRESLALFPRRRNIYPYVEGEAVSGVTTVALSPDGQHFAWVSGGKLNVYESGKKKPFRDLDCQCTEVALNNGATLVAAITGDGGLMIYDLKTKVGRALPAYGDSPDQIALSPGGHYLAVTTRLGESDGQHSKMSVVDVSSGKVVKTFDDYIDTPGDRNTGGEASAPGNPSASGGALAGDITSGACDNFNMVINDVAFGPNGNLAVGGEYNIPQGLRRVGRVVVWELGLGGGAAERDLSEADFAAPEIIRQEMGVQAIAPGTDATYFATETGVWKRLPGSSEFEPFARLPRVLTPPFVSYVKALAFGPDGTSLTLLRKIQGDQNSKDNDEEAIEVWDSAGHRDWARVSLTEEATGLTFNPRSELVAAATGEHGTGPARVFNAFDGQEAEGVTFGPGREDGKEWAISPDADFTLSADNKTAIVRDVWGKTEVVVPLDGALGELGPAAISPGGKFFALARADEKGDHFIVVYRSDGRAYRKWNSIPQVGDDFEDPVTMSLSADGRSLAVHYSGGEDIVRVWDVGGGRDISPDSLKSTFYFRSVKIGLSHNGRFLVTTDIDGETTLMDLSEGRRAQWQPLTEEADIRFHVFSRDGSYMALGSEDGVLYVFDLKSSGGAQEIARLKHTGRVTAAAFSDDGKYVVTASSALNRFNTSESYPLRTWLLRPSDLLDEAKARTDSLRNPSR